MAVAYESVSTVGWTDLQGGGNLVITKPTGLAVGDYMVAHLSNIVGGSPNADGWNTPSGWSALTDSGEDGNSNSSMQITTFYKVADSSDVAASNFTFTKASADNAYSNGSIWRISGAGGISAAADTEIDDTTPSFTNSVTQDFADSLILFFVTSAFAGTGTNSVSGYSIANNDPSWTEAYDQNINETTGADRGCHAGAYASRSATGATGNSTCTLSQTQNTGGVIVVLSPIINVTTTMDGAGIVTLSSPEKSFTLDYIIPVDSAGTVTLSTPEPTISTSTKTAWTNETKPSTTWTNE